MLVSLSVSAMLIGGSVGSAAAATRIAPAEALIRQETLFQQDGNSVRVPTW